MPPPSALENPVEYLSYATGHSYALINAVLLPEQLHGFLPALKVMKVNIGAFEGLFTQRNVFKHRSQGESKVC